MEFGHTTRASKLTKDKLLELVLGKLSDEEKANLRKILVMKKAARNSGFYFYTASNLFVATCAKKLLLFLYSGCVATKLSIRLIKRLGSVTLIFSALPIK